MSEQVRIWGRTVSAERDKIVCKCFIGGEFQEWKSAPVQVEADVSSGLPCFTMVGFPSTQVKEAQDRVRTALKNNGISLPPKKVTVNLAPADLRKEGAGFDLPVAAAVLAASGFIETTASSECNGGWRTQSEWGGRGSIRECCQE